MIIFHSILPPLALFLNNSSYNLEQLFSVYQATNKKTIVFIQEEIRAKQQRRRKKKKKILFLFDFYVVIMPNQSLISVSGNVDD